MNRSAVLGTVFGITAATAAVGIAGYVSHDRKEGEAVADAQAQLAQTCYEAPVERSVEPRDENRVAGTIIGALVGGAVGKDVGDRDITTAAGAAAGAYAGNQIQKKIQENHTVTTTEQRCSPASAAN